MGRPALSDAVAQNRSFTIRLDAAHYEQLQALVARASGSAGPLAAASFTTVVRGLISLAYAQGEAPQPPPTPQAARAPSRAAPTAADSDLDAVLSALVKLGAKVTGGLVDAVALVRASRLAPPAAHAALEALRVAGAVELRPDTSPDIREPANEFLRPRTALGEPVGYVARLGPSKGNTRIVSKAKPARPSAPSSHTDDELRAAVKRSGAEGKAKRLALRKTAALSEGTFTSWMSIPTRRLPAQGRAALVRELRRLEML